MLEEISESINVPIEGKITAFDGAQDSSNRYGKHNKSMDFDRHVITSPRKGNKSSIGKKNENNDACGDSYATLGASFMGESFANISMSVLALDGLDFDSDLDDECGDDELEYERERMVSHQITQKSRLDAIADFEDDEDDDRKKD